MSSGDRYRERDFGIEKTGECRWLRAFDTITMRKDKFIEEEAGKVDFNRHLKGVSDRPIQQRHSKICCGNYGCLKQLDSSSGLKT